MSTATRTYPNPLIPGFYPDPSVVKVGEDYYLANSTFEYLPGIPVFHSRDLVELGADRPRRRSLRASSVRNCPTNGGAWAPTIRHRDGTFYVVVTDAMGRGMLIFTATDPAGPWSDGTLVGRNSRHRPGSRLGRPTAPPTSPTPAWTPPRAPRWAADTGGILQITVDLETGKPLDRSALAVVGHRAEVPGGAAPVLHDGGTGT